MKELTFAVIATIVVYLIIAVPLISVAGAVGGLVAIFITGVILFSFWCVGKGIENIARIWAKEYVRQMTGSEKDNEEEHYMEQNVSDKVWLCPICGYWQKNPKLHLKRKHKINDDMIEFWIKKGRWT